MSSSSFARRSPGQHRLTPMGIRWVTEQPPPLIGTPLFLRTITVRTNDLGSQARRLHSSHSTRDICTRLMDGFCVCGTTMTRTHVRDFRFGSARCHGRSDLVCLAGSTTITEGLLSARSRLLELRRGASTKWSPTFLC